MFKSFTLSELETLLNVIDRARELNTYNELHEELYELYEELSYEYLDKYVSYQDIEELLEPMGNL